LASGARAKLAGATAVEDVAGGRQRSQSGPPRRVAARIWAREGTKVEGMGVGEDRGLGRGRGRGRRSRGGTGQTVGRQQGLVIVARGRIELAAHLTGVLGLDCF
jgi:hypothetical protein